MNRADIIEILAEKYPTLTRKDSEAMVESILEAIAQALQNGQRVEIRGFGSFAVQHRGERLARNPRTGEKLMVPVKKSAHFKAGKELRDVVNLAKRV